MPSFLSSTLARVAWCQIAFKIIAPFDGVVGCLHWKNPLLNMCIVHFFLEVCLLSLAKASLWGLISDFDIVVGYLHWKIGEESPPQYICIILQEQLGICMHWQIRKKHPPQYVHFLTSMSALA